MQLHRDTSVQALTLSPSLKDGRVYFDDSALVAASCTAEFSSSMRLTKRHSHRMDSHRHNGPTLAPPCREMSGQQAREANGRSCARFDETELTTMIGERCDHSEPATEADSCECAIDGAINRLVNESELTCL